MRISPDEWRRRTAPKQAANLAAQRPHLMGLAQAAVRMELLTGNEAWDHFLRYLEAAKEKFVEARQVADAALVSGVVVGHDDILRWKILRAEAHAQVQLVDAIMTLPKDVISDGEKAKGLLERLGEAA